MGKITRQSTTDDEFLYLLGLSIWVFNSNCHFIIEMIDKEHHNNSEVAWSMLINLTAGNLKDYKDLVINVLGEDIYYLFDELVDKRNTIIHSFPTGEKVDSYTIPIYRNTKKNKNVRIDKYYLRDFVKRNEKLCSLIYDARGY